MQFDDLPPANLWLVTVLN